MRVPCPKYLPVSLRVARWPKDKVHAVVVGCGNMDTWAGTDCILYLCDKPTEWGET